MSGAINAMDISDCGSYIVSGGDDKLVKVRNRKLFCCNY